MIREIRTATVMLCWLTVITGLAYPAAVTGLAQLLFTDAARGSLVTHADRVAGSRLLGQPFHDPAHFWSRPSATSPLAYNGAASSGSNLAATNPALRQVVEQRIAALRAADPGNAQPIPVDLVTASGSGLDPHISPAAAEFQLARVARARGLPEARVRALVQRFTEPRTFGLLGEPRVDVLQLNLALDDSTRK